MKTMTESQQLLQEYVEHGSESAFRELVARYVDLVHSVALRLVGGDCHLAEDVTQTVFVRLAQKARLLSRDSHLGGWLHRDTCFVARSLMRRERRRLAREHEAALMNSVQNDSEPNWDRVAPILDEAINALGAGDRTAILLRFFEKRDFRSVGIALGSSEDAARMRVNRALEKLQLLLRQRGVTLSVSALAATLASQAVAAAPAALTFGIAGAALAGAGSSSSLASTIFSGVVMGKMKSGVFGMIAVASLIAPLVIYQRSQAALEAGKRDLQRRSETLTMLSQENQRLLALATKPIENVDGADLNELMRLRSEVGRLRNDARKFAGNTTNNASDEKKDEEEETIDPPLVRLARLKEWLESNPSQKIPELQFLTKDKEWVMGFSGGVMRTDEQLKNAMRAVRGNAEMKFIEMLFKAVKEYRKSNGGQFPADMFQLKPYFAAPIEDAVLERYAVVPKERVRHLIQHMSKHLGASGAEPGSDRVIIKKAPVDIEYDNQFIMGGTNGFGIPDDIKDRWELK